MINIKTRLFFIFNLNIFEGKFIGWKKGKDSKKIWNKYIFLKYIKIKIRPNKYIKKNIKEVH